MSSGQKTLQESSKAQRGLPGSSPLRSDGSLGSQAGRLDYLTSGLKRSRRNRKTTSDSPWTYLTGKVTAQLKESTYSLFPGC